MQIYDKIEARKITAEYNEIDQARDMLQALLDDDNISVSSEAGEVIQRALNLIQ